MDIPLRKAGRPRKDTPPIDPSLLQKTCEACRQLYFKPVIETWARWSVRKFCSLDCFYSHR